jgi:hypothetical protein
MNRRSLTESVPIADSRSKPPYPTSYSAPSVVAGVTMTQPVKPALKNATGKKIPATGSVNTAGRYSASKKTNYPASVPIHVPEKLVTTQKKDS